MPERSVPLHLQTQEFHERLYALKQKTPLPDGAAWYPWASLGQFDTFDKLIGSDPARLGDLIGGLPVLDVGCGDGDVSFFLESLGARVEAIDHAPTNYNLLAGVRTMKQVLGSNIGIHTVDLDTQPNLPGTGYGLCIMLGVLYHLKNPFLVLETLARHSRHIFISTRIASRDPARKHRYGGLPLAYLVDEDELNADATNFWIFTEAGFRRILKRTGWDVLHYASTGPSDSDPVTPQGDARGFIVARSRVALAPPGVELLQGWHHVEFDSWRWTERRFSVALERPVPGNAGSLHFQFQLPEPVFAGRETVALSARLNGQPIGTETYRTPGAHHFTAPFGETAQSPVTLEFELDHAIPPSDNDRRELGALVDFSGAPPITLT